MKLFKPNTRNDIFITGFQCMLFIHITTILQKIEFLFSTIPSRISKNINLSLQYTRVHPLFLSSLYIQQDPFET